MTAAAGIYMFVLFGMLLWPVVTVAISFLLAAIIARRRNIRLLRPKLFAISVAAATYLLTIVAGPIYFSIGSKLGGWGKGGAGFRTMDMAQSFAIEIVAICSISYLLIVWWLPKWRVRPTEPDASPRPPSVQ